MAECESARTCSRRESCPYARTFEPSAIAPGPSGLADWPRPFVFRATHLEGRTFGPGDRFCFDLNLFDTRTPVIAHLVSTFAQLAREGLGPKRSRVELEEVSHLNEQGVHESAVEHQPPLGFNLDPPPEPVSHVLVKFVTPTQLKPAARPEFGILAARVRDRISTLRELYGDGALEMDFQAFGERASLVKMTRCEINHVDVQRRSSRTGQVHSIGGFIGEAEYQGELREFVPYLKLAKWTGVGRQTVWGKGEIEIAVNGLR